MATYTTIPSSVAAHGKSMLITSVAAGDRIDIKSILGRSASNVKLIMTDDTDTVTYKLNNLVRVQKFNETRADETVEIWSGSPRYPTYSSTGQLEHEIGDGLRVDSIEIVSVTLSIGTTIEIVVW
jgi:hypothetical protein